MDGDDNFMYCGVWKKRFDNKLTPMWNRVPAEYLEVCQRSERSS